MSQTTEIQDEAPEGYKQVQLGPRTLPVPTDWGIKRVDEITENLDRKREPIKSSKRESGDIPYYGATGQVDSVSGYLFDEKLVLVGEDGADWSPFGGTSYIISGKSWVNNHVHVLRCTEIVEEFLSNYLDYIEMRQVISGTNRGKLNQSELNQFPVIYPPLPEQRRIANILSTVDESIQQTDEMIEETKELREGLMQDLYTSGIENETFSTHRIGPREIEIPTHWKLRTVNELKSTTTSKKAIRGGPPGGRIKKSDRSEDGAKLYVQENVIQNDFKRRGDYLSAEKFEELQSAEVDPGDVLITRSGTIGRSEVFPDDAQRGILGSSLIRVKVNEDIIRPQYLSQFLADSHTAQSQIKAMSHGGTRTGLNNKIVKSIQVAVPPIDEQDRISKVLKTVEEKIQQEKQHRDDLKDLKRGLMQDLLTGKIRVNTD